MCFSTRALIPLLLLGLMVFPASARAQGEPTVRFEELAAYRRGPELLVDYRLHPESWRRLEGLRVQPQLELRVRSGDRAAPFNQTFAFTLASPSQRLRLGVPPGLSQFTLRAQLLAGPGSAHRVRGFSLAGIDVEAANLLLSPGWPDQRGPHGRPHHPPLPGPGGGEPVFVPAPPPPPPRWAAQPATIQLCNATFFSAADQQLCLQACAAATLDPLPAVRACAAGFYAAADKLACVRSAVRAQRPVEALIQACVGAMYQAADKLACLDALVSARLDPLPLVASCGEVLYHTADKLECLRASAAARFPAPGTIQTCGQSFYQGAAKLECIRLGTTVAHDPTPTIKACSAVNGDDRKLQCLRTSLGM
ncbi:MAG: hypothetical protein RBU45_19480 [Myxococcota bacterium]|jgi:hypothetical protein|nr:hypothetical protein [Myxococcota bacterium]